eukprot:5758801-Prymnesium_polylepis.2
MNINPTSTYINTNINLHQPITTAALQPITAHGHAAMRAGAGIWVGNKLASRTAIAAVLAV